MTDWLLITEAGPDVGLGHLSRMCGLGQAMRNRGGDPVLVVLGDGIEYLADRVGPAAVHEDWWPGPYVRWTRTDSIKGLIQGANYVVDVKAPSYRARLVGDRDINHYLWYGAVEVADWVPASDAADVIVCPHATAFTTRWPQGVPVLGGLGYYPLRAVWRYDNRSKVDYMGRVWYDPRLTDVSVRTTVDDTKLDEAVWVDDPDRAGVWICAVGVRMYEGLASRRRVYALTLPGDPEAPDKRDLAGPLRAGPDTDLLTMHTYGDVVASGAASLAGALMDRNFGKA